jgi:hypothetical protein
VSVSLTRIAIVASLLLAVTLAMGIAVSDASAATSLRDRLENAQRELKKANQRLEAAQIALAAALTAESAPLDSDATSEAPASAVLTAPAPALAAAPAASEPADVKALQTRVEQALKQVSAWKKRVRELTAQVEEEEQIAAWEREGDWLPIMKIAAARYHVKADGMYRMMLRESGGDPRAGASGQFRGLFQYWTGTWRNSWNPWRDESIFDGSSQIFATAYAIHKGMGPQMWTTTFASQY